ncbi:hypothetical protein O181_120601 [Austropuccinia psidii MF-1]|uniref:Uncharacterized protein n=1 Tax=Austropuccinia psidii MF-1 TaxID=1389203 RepID=A0A9Q3KIR2_9BASI|nr:hypothetical protein [Austropuccinia psidii MF-1]
MAHEPYFTAHSLCATHHGPCTVDPLGPFWPQSNEATRGQAGSPDPRFWPNPQTIKGPGPKNPKMTIHFYRPSILNSWSMETNGGHQFTCSRVSLQDKGNPPPNHGPQATGTMNGAYMVLYTIMHHFS